MKINTNFMQGAKNGANQNAVSNQNPKLPTIDPQGNRLCYFLNIYVSRDGKTLYGLDPITGTRNDCQVQYDKQGNPYIFVNGKKCNVDFAVAVCYKPAPKDKKHYEIVHLDGNPNNCDANNLEWRLPQPILNQMGTNPFSQTAQQSPNTNAGSMPQPHLSPYQQPQQKKPYFLNTYQECKIRELTINKNGEVFEGNVKLDLNDNIFDSDTALTVCISPYVHPSNGKRYHMDELVRTARFVEGTPDGKMNPKILHKDHNRNNYASSNLQWVEENSPEYQDFRRDEIEYMRKRNIELNPGMDFPEFMQPK